MQLLASHAINQHVEDYATTEGAERDGVAHLLAVNVPALLAEIAQLRSAVKQAIDFASLHGPDRPVDDIAQEVLANLRKAILDGRLT